jgi:hypothetical protein
MERKEGSMMHDSYEDEEGHGGMPPRARPSDPWTSHLAIPPDESFDDNPEHLGPEQLRYLKILGTEKRPLAAFQVTKIAGRDMWRRASELKHKGLIEKVGLAYNANRPCETFQPTALGKFVLARKEGKPTKDK